MLQPNEIYCGDSRELLQQIEPESLALSFWSPPYFLGKDYEQGVSYDQWQQMLSEVISLHYHILKPGGFMIINIADILAFQDEKMPRIQADNPSNKKCSVTREMVLEAKRLHPDYNRDKLAAFLNCSEQTIDRRLNGNNIRGGRHSVGTHVKLVGGQLEQYAYDSGLYLYDKRIWQKDPAWANSKWTTSTLKAVSETEDLYVFWKPGSYVVNRNRLTPSEWKEWGLRQVWNIPSVRANDIHQAMFPLELAFRVIRLYTDEGDIVLDPFLGSGTTVLAAIEAKRQYIGIEMMEQYADLARQRVKRVKMTPKLDFD
ncbi:MAG: site-specific DNA-methyltransferase [Bacteroidales bacterium]|nr:site-specific DNA-methyltransferase [Bacteroidales bacterium]